MLPRVCWEARPRITAVNAPPTASVPASSPAIRSATIALTITVTKRTMNPTVPAVAGSIRPKSAGAIPRPRDRAMPQPKTMRAMTVAIRAGVPRPGKSERRCAKRMRTPAISSPKSRTPPRAREASARSTWLPRPTWRHCSVRLSKIGLSRRNNDIQGRLPDRPPGYTCWLRSARGRSGAAARNPRGRRRRAGRPAPGSADRRAVPDRRRRQRRRPRLRRRPVRRALRNPIRVRARGCARARTTATAAGSGR